MRKRERPIYPINSKVEDLDSFEITTLFSLQQDIFIKKDYKLILTKEGGYWPIILTSLYSNFDISTEDIRLSTDKAMEVYNYLRYNRKYVPFFNSSDIEILDVFLKNLLGMEYYDYSIVGNYYNYSISGSYNRDFVHPLPYFVDKVANDYYWSLKDLVERGLIEDPYNTENLEKILLMDTAPKYFNKITPKGKEKIQTIMQIVEGKREVNIENTIKNFNKSLLELYRMFVSQIIEKTV